MLVFRKVSEVSGTSSGRFRSAGVVLRVCMCWCKCWRQVPEGSGKSCVWWCKFRERFRKVSEGLKAVCGLATLRATTVM